MSTAGITYREWKADPCLSDRGNTGILAQTHAENDARSGSITLERECRKVIERQAMAWGIRCDQAEALLLDRVAKL